MEVAETTKVVGLTRPLRHIVLGTLVVVVFCYPLLHGRTTLVLVGLAVRIMCVALLVFATLRQPAEQRGPSWMFTAGLLGIGAGLTLTGLGNPAPGTVVLLTAFGLIVAAAYQFVSIRKARRRPDVDVMLDLGAVLAAAAILLHQLPGWRLGTGAPAGVLFGVAVLVVGGRILFDRTTPVAGWLLGVAAVTMTAGGIAVMVTRQNPGDPAGVAGALFVAPNLFVAAAATHPKMAQLTSPPSEPPPGTTRRFPAVAIALGVPLVAMAASYIRDVRLTWFDLVMAVVIFALVTVRVGRAFQARDRADRRLMALVDSAVDGISVLTPDGTVQFEAGETARRFGVGKGNSVLSVIHPDDVAMAVEELGRVGDRSGNTSHVELRIRSDEDEWKWVECTAVNRMDDSAVGGIIVSFLETTERHEAAARLEHRALHDVLTGLPNRAYLAECLTEALARNRRRGTDVAVLFCDLDRFKLINDSAGHTAGDTVLLQTARRLSESVRSTDVVTRFGGDEFVVVCQGLHVRGDALDVAERLHAAIARPFTLADRDVTVSVSIGAAISRGAAATAETLVRDADAAMYRAKERGRNRIVEFDAAMRRSILERVDIERQLRTALGTGQFEVHYQPVVSLAEQSVSGVEALVRWRHPDRGLLDPDKFVAVASEAGLMVPIGRFVLSQALGQLASWRTEPATARIIVAINLSAPELADPGLTAYVVALLERYEVPASSVTFEVTEETLPNDWAAAHTIRALRDLGVGIALDDFGTGYSSLSHLMSLPVDTVKVDRSFVSRLGAGGDAIVAGVVRMAHSLGIRVIAEGVETEAQRKRLCDLGADGGQGWLFGKPVPARQLGSSLEIPILGGGPPPRLATRS